MALDEKLRWTNIWHMGPRIRQQLSLLYLVAPLFSCS